VPAALEAFRVAEKVLGELRAEIPAEVRPADRAANAALPVSRRS
jgi:hypothetical protein